MPLTQYSKSRRCRCVAFLICAIFFTTSIMGGSPQAFAMTSLPSTITSYLNISENCGTIHETFTSDKSQSPTVILIQDAHANYEIQKNIEHIISSLPIKNIPLSIYVEGSVGEIDTSFIRAFPLQEKKKEIIDSYVAKGSISGPEEFSIIAQEPVELYGVDHEKLYVEHVKTYGDIAAQQERIQRYLNTKEKVLEEEKRNILSENLYGFLEQRKKYGTQGEDLVKYFRYLLRASRKVNVSTTPYEYISKLEKIEIYQKNIDVGSIKRETTECMEAIIDRVADSKPARREYAGVSTAGEAQGARKTKDSLLDTLALKELDFRGGRIVPYEFYSFLKETCLKLDIDFRTFSNINRYYYYLWLLDDIEVKKLDGERKKLEEKILAALACTPEEKELIKNITTFDILKRLLILKATPEDVAYFRKHKSRFFRMLQGDTQLPITNLKNFNYGKQSLTPTDSHPQGGLPGRAVDVRPGALSHSRYQLSIQSTLALVDRFYTLAQKRELHLVRNTLRKIKQNKENAAILVAGGYHTPGIIENLKKRKISYVVITPRIHELPQENLYEKIMASYDTYFGVQEGTRGGTVQLFSRIQYLPAAGKNKRLVDELLTEIRQKFVDEIEQEKLRIGEMKGGVAPFDYYTQWNKNVKEWIIVDYKDGHGAHFVKREWINEALKKHTISELMAMERDLKIGTVVEYHYAPVISHKEMHIIEYIYAESEKEKADGPYIVGIGGRNGVGKTTFAKDVLRKMLEKKEKRVLVISEDEFIKDPAARKALGTEWDENHIRLNEAREFLEKVHRGEKIITYNRYMRTKEGKVVTPFTINISDIDILIFDGLHAINSEKRLGNLNQFIDCPIFMDAKIENWKKWRAQKERKKPNPLSPKEMEKHHREGNLPDAERNILPSKKNAHFVIWYDDKRNISLIVSKPRANTMGSDPSWACSPPPSDSDPDAAARREWRKVGDPDRILYDAEEQDSSELLTDTEHRALNRLFRNRYEVDAQMAQSLVERFIQFFCYTSYFTEQYEGKLDAVLHALIDESDPLLLAMCDYVVEHLRIRGRESYSYLFRSGEAQQQEFVSHMLDILDKKRAAGESTVTILIPGCAFGQELVSWKWILEHGVKPQVSDFDSFEFEFIGIEKKPHVCAQAQRYLQEGYDIISAIGDFDLNTEMQKQLRIQQLQFLQYINNNISEFSSGCTIVEGDVTSDAFSTYLNSADIVIFNHVIHYLNQEETDAVCENIFDVCEEGNSCILGDDWDDCLKVLVSSKLHKTKVPVEEMFRLWPATFLADTEPFKKEFERLDQIEPDRRVGHIFTVGEHSRETVNQVDALLDESSEVLQPLQDALVDIENAGWLWILRFAALCHDMGKMNMRAPDDPPHAERSAGKLLEQLFIQVGLPLDRKEAKLIKWLIHNHHAVYTNIKKYGDESEDGDGALIHLLNKLPKDEFSREERVRAMHMLMLLSYGDWVATNPREHAQGTWGFHTFFSLYQRIHHTLMGDIDEWLERERHTIGAWLEDYLTEKGIQDISRKQELIKTYFELMPADTLIDGRKDIIGQQILFLSELDERPCVRTYDIMTETAEPYQSIVIGRRGVDAPGFLRNITGVLSLYGYDIHRAEVLTHPSGIIWDRFICSYIPTEQKPSAPSQAELEADIERLFNNEISIFDLYKEKDIPYIFSKKQHAPTDIETRITFDEEDSTQTRMRISACDRKGLLHLITTVLHDDFKVNVNRANIYTQGYIVDDLFYVDYAGKALSADMQKAIEKRFIALLSVPTATLVGSKDEVKDDMLMRIDNTYSFSLDTRPVRRLMGDLATLGSEDIPLQDLMRKDSTDHVLSWGFSHSYPGNGKQLDLIKRSFAQFIIKHNKADKKINLYFIGLGTEPGEAREVVKAFNHVLYSIVRNEKERKEWRVHCVGIDIDLDIVKGIQTLDNFNTLPDFDPLLTIEFHRAHSLDYERLVEIGKMNKADYIFNRHMTFQNQLAACHCFNYSFLQQQPSAILISYLSLYNIFNAFAHKGTVYVTEPVNIEHVSQKLRQDIDLQHICVLRIPGTRIKYGNEMGIYNVIDPEILIRGGFLSFMDAIERQEDLSGITASHNDDEIRSIIEEIKDSKKGYVPVEVTDHVAWSIPFADQVRDVVMYPDGRMKISDDKKQSWRILTENEFQIISQLFTSDDVHTFISKKIHTMWNSAVTQRKILFEIYSVDPLYLPRYKNNTIVIDSSPKSATGYTISDTGSIYMGVPEIAPQEDETNEHIQYITALMHTIKSIPSDRNILLHQYPEMLNVWKNNQQTRRIMCDLGFTQIRQFPHFMNNEIYGFLPSQPQSTFIIDLLHATIAVNGGMPKPAGLAEIDSFMERFALPEKQLRKHFGNAYYGGRSILKTYREVKNEWAQMRESRIGITEFYFRTKSQNNKHELFFTTIFGTSYGVTEGGAVQFRDTQGTWVTIEKEQKGFPEGKREEQRVHLSHMDEYIEKIADRVVGLRKYWEPKKDELLKQWRLADISDNTIVRVPTFNTDKTILTFYFIDGVQVLIDGKGDIWTETNFGPREKASASYTNEAMQDMYENLVRDRIIGNADMYEFLQKAFKQGKINGSGLRIVSGKKDRDTGGSITRINPLTQTPYELNDVIENVLGRGTFMMCTRGEITELTSLLSYYLKEHTAKTREEILHRVTKNITYYGDVSWYAEQMGKWFSDTSDDEIREYYDALLYLNTLLDPNKEPETDLFTDVFMRAQQQKKAQEILQDPELRFMIVPSFYPISALEHAGSHGIYLSLHVLRDAIKQKENEELSGKPFHEGISIDMVMQAVLYHAATDKYNKIHTDNIRKDIFDVLYTWWEDLDYTFLASLMSVYQKDDTDYIEWDLSSLGYHGYDAIHIYSNGRMIFLDDERKKRPLTDEEYEFMCTIFNKMLTQYPNEEIQDIWNEAQQKRARSLEIYGCESTYLPEIINLDRFTIPFLNSGEKCIICDNGTIIIDDQIVLIDKQDTDERVAYITQLMTHIMACSDRDNELFMSSAGRIRKIWDRNRLYRFYGYTADSELPVVRGHERVEGTLWMTVEEDGQERVKKKHYVINEMTATVLVSNRLPSAQEWERLRHIFTQVHFFVGKVNGDHKESVVDIFKATMAKKRDLWKKYQIREFSFVSEGDRNGYILRFSVPNIQFRIKTNGDAEIKYGPNEWRPTVDEEVNQMGNYITQIGSVVPQVKKRWDDLYAEIKKERKLNLFELFDPPLPDPDGMYIMFRRYGEFVEIDKWGGVWVQQMGRWRPEKPEGAGIEYFAAMTKDSDIGDPELYDFMQVAIKRRHAFMEKREKALQYTDKRRWFLQSVLGEKQKHLYDTWKKLPGPEYIPHLEYDAEDHQIIMKGVLPRFENVPQGTEYTITVYGALTLNGSADIEKIFATDASVRERIFGFIKDIMSATEELPWVHRIELRRFFDQVHAFRERMRENGFSDPWQVRILHYPLLISDNGNNRGADDLSSRREKKTNARTQSLIKVISVPVDDTLYYLLDNGQLAQLDYLTKSEKTVAVLEGEVPDTLWPPIKSTLERAAQVDPSIQKFVSGLIHAREERYAARDNNVKRFDEHSISHRDPKTREQIDPDDVIMNYFEGGAALPFTYINLQVLSDILKEYLNEDDQHTRAQLIKHFASQLTGDNEYKEKFLNWFIAIADDALIQKYVDVLEFLNYLLSQKFNDTLLIDPAAQDEAYYELIGGQLRYVLVPDFGGEQVFAHAGKGIDEETPTIYLSLDMLHAIHTKGLEPRTYGETVPIPVIMRAVLLHEAYETEHEHQDNINPVIFEALEELWDDVHVEKVSPPISTGIEPSVYHNWIRMGLLSWLFIILVAYGCSLYIPLLPSIGIGCTLYGLVYYCISRRYRYAYTETDKRNLFLEKLLKFKIKKKDAQRIVNAIKKEEDMFFIEGLFNMIKIYHNENGGIDKNLIAPMLINVARAKNIKQRAAEVRGMIIPLSKFFIHMVSRSGIMVHYKDSLISYIMNSDSMKEKFEIIRHVLYSLSCFIPHIEKSFPRFMPYKKGAIENILFFMNRYNLFTKPHIKELSHTAQQAVQYKRERKKIENQVKSQDILKKNIIKIQETGKKEYVSATVVGETNNAYLLFTQGDAVADYDDSTHLMAYQSGKNRKEHHLMGCPVVVLRGDADQDPEQNIALLILFKNDENRTSLEPLPRAEEFDTNIPAVVVSEGGKRVVSGNLTRLGEMALLMGASTSREERGAPYIINIDGTYKACAIHSMDGAIGIPLTQALFGDLYKAVQGLMPDDYLIVTQDRDALNAAKEFLAVQTGNRPSYTQPLVTHNMQAREAYHLIQDLISYSFDCRERMDIPQAEDTIAYMHELYHRFYQESAAIQKVTKEIIKVSTYFIDRLKKRGLLHDAQRILEQLIVFLDSDDTGSEEILLPYESVKSVIWACTDLANIFRKTDEIEKAQKTLQAATRIYFFYSKSDNEVATQAPYIRDAYLNLITRSIQLSQDEEITAALITEAEEFIEKNRANPQYEKMISEYIRVLVERTNTQSNDREYRVAYKLYQHINVFFRQYKAYVGTVEVEEGIFTLGRKITAGLYSEGHIDSAVAMYHLIHDLYTESSHKEHYTEMYNFFITMGAKLTFKQMRNNDITGAYKVLERAAYYLYEGLDKKIVQEEKLALISKQYDYLGKQYAKLGNTDESKRMYLKSLDLIQKYPTAPKSDELLALLIDEVTATARAMRTEEKVFDAYTFLYTFWLCIERKQVPWNSKCSQLILKELRFIVDSFVRMRDEVNALRVLDVIVEICKKFCTIQGSEDEIRSTIALIEHIAPYLENREHTQAHVLPKKIKILLQLLNEQKKLQESGNKTSGIGILSVFLSFFFLTGFRYVENISPLPILIGICGFIACILISTIETPLDKFHETVVTRIDTLLHSVSDDIDVHLYMRAEKRLKELYEVYAKYEGTYADVRGRLEHIVRLAKILAERYRRNMEEEPGKEHRYVFSKQTVVALGQSRRVVEDACSFFTAYGFRSESLFKRDVLLHAAARIVSACHNLARVYDDCGQVGNELEFITHAQEIGAFFQWKGDGALTQELLYVVHAYFDYVIKCAEKGDQRTLRNALASYGAFLESVKKHRKYFNILRSTSKRAFALSPEEGVKIIQDVVISQIVDVEKTFFDNDRYNKALKFCDTMVRFCVDNATKRTPRFIDLLLSLQRTRIQQQLLRNRFDDAYGTAVALCDAMLKRKNICTQEQIVATREMINEVALALHSAGKTDRIEALDSKMRILSTPPEKRPVSSAKKGILLTIFLSFFFLTGFRYVGEVSYLTKILSVILMSAVVGSISVIVNPKSMVRQYSLNAFSLDADMVYRLRMLMALYSYNQKNVAEQLGISEQLVSHYITGKENIPVSRMCELEDLFLGEGCITDPLTFKRACEGFCLRTLMTLHGLSNSDVAGMLKKTSATVKAMCSPKKNIPSKYYPFFDTLFGKERCLQDISSFYDAYTQVVRERIDTITHFLGLTQKDMADRLHIKLSRYEKWINGMHLYNKKIISRFEEVLLGPGCLTDGLVYKRQVIGYSLPRLMPCIGITEQELARKIDCSDRCFNGWKNAAVLMNEEHQSEIEEVFGVQHCLTDPQAYAQVRQNYFRERIKEAMLILRYNAQDIAEKLKVKKSLVLRWTAQKGVIQDKYIQELERILLGENSVRNGAIFKQAFAQRCLDLLMKATGITAQQLSQAVNIERHSIAQWRKGKGQIYRYHIDALEDYFGLQGCLRESDAFLRVERKALTTNLKQLKKYCGLTWNVIAHMTGVSSNALITWCKEKTFLQSDTLKKVERGLFKEGVLCDRTVYKEALKEKVFSVLLDSALQLPYVNEDYSNSKKKYLDLRYHLRTISLADIMACAKDVLVHKQYDRFYAMVEKNIASDKKVLIELESINYEKFWTSSVEIREAYVFTISKLLYSFDQTVRIAAQGKLWEWMEKYLKTFKQEDEYDIASFILFRSVYNFNMYHFQKDVSLYRALCGYVAQSLGFARINRLRDSVPKELRPLIHSILRLQNEKRQKHYDYYLTVEEIKKQATDFSEEDIVIALQVLNGSVTKSLTGKEGEFSEWMLYQHGVEKEELYGNNEFESYDDEAHSRMHDSQLLLANSMPSRYEGRSAVLHVLINSYIRPLLTYMQTWILRPLLFLTFATPIHEYGHIVFARFFKEPVTYTMKGLFWEGTVTLPEDAEARNGGPLMNLLTSIMIAGQYLFMKYGGCIILGYCTVVDVCSSPMIWTYLKSYLALAFYVHLAAAAYEIFAGFIFNKGDFKEREYPRLMLPDPKSPKAVILYAEDSDRKAAKMMYFFRKNGYLVIRCQNAEEAIEYIDAKRQFDILITDNYMPNNNDGVGLLRYLRNQEVHQNTPAILYSKGSFMRVKEARVVNAKPINKFPFTGKRKLKKELESVVKTGALRSEKEHNKLFGYGIALFCSAAIAFKPLFAKTLNTLGVHAFIIQANYYLMAGMTLLVVRLVILLVQKKPLIEMENTTGEKGSLKRVIGMIGLSILFAQILASPFFYWSIQHSYPLVSELIVKSSPVLVLVASPFIKKYFQNTSFAYQHIGMKSIVGAGMAVLGIGAVVVGLKGGETFGYVTIFGIMCALVSVMSYVASEIIKPETKKIIKTTSLLLISYFIALPVMVMLTYVVADGFVFLFDWHMYLIALISLVTLLLSFKAHDYLDVLEIRTVGGMSPLFLLLYGTLFYALFPGWLASGGVVVAFVGLWILVRGNKKQIIRIKTFKSKSYKHEYDYNILYAYIIQMLAKEPEIRYQEDLDHGLMHAEDLIEKAEILSLRLPNKESINWKVLITAILLHDAVYKSGDDHGEIGAYMVDALFSGRGLLTDKEIEKAKDAIRLHDKKDESYRDKRHAAGIEAELLYDVDNWDAFGIKGVYRYICAYAKREKTTDDLRNEVLDNIQRRRKSVSFAETQTLVCESYNTAKKFFERLIDEYKSGKDKQFGATAIVRFIHENYTVPPRILATKMLYTLSQREVSDEEREGYEYMVHFFKELDQAYDRPLWKMVNVQKHWWSAKQVPVILREITPDRVDDVVSTFNGMRKMPQLFNKKEWELNNTWISYGQKSVIGQSTLFGAFAGNRPLGLCSVELPYKDNRELFVEVQRKWQRYDIDMKLQKYARECLSQTGWLWTMPITDKNPSAMTEHIEMDDFVDATSADSIERKDERKQNEITIQELKKTLLFRVLVAYLGKVYEEDVRGFISEMVAQVIEDPAEAFYVENALMYAAERKWSAEKVMQSEIMNVALVMSIRMAKELLRFENTDIAEVMREAGVFTYKNIFVCGHKNEEFSESMRRRLAQFCYVNEYAVKHVCMQLRRDGEVSWHMVSSHINTFDAVIALSDERGVYGTFMGLIQNKISNDRYRIVSLQKKEALLSACEIADVLKTIHQLWKLTGRDGEREFTDEAKRKLSYYFMSRGQLANMKAITDLLLQHGSFMITFTETLSEKIAAVRIHQKIRQFA